MTARRCAAVHAVVEREHPHPALRTARRRRGFAGQGGGCGPSACSFLEEEKGGQGFPGNLMLAKHGHHLVREGTDLGRLPLFQVGDDQLERDESGFKGIAVREELLADLAKETSGLLEVAEPGGDGPPPTSGEGGPGRSRARPPGRAAPEGGPAPALFIATRPQIDTFRECRGEVNCVRGPPVARPASLLIGDY